MTTAAAGAALAAPALGRPMFGAAPRSGHGPLIVGSGEHTYEVIHDWCRVPAEISLGNTHGVAEDAAGNIYIKHTVHASSTSPDAVAVFDQSGRFVRSWGAEYRGGAHGLHLSREPGGEFFYICDQARGVVDKTTLTGGKVWTRGCPMESGLYSSAGEYHPTNVAVVPSGPRAGEFFVGDGYGKNWIHRYSAASEYLGSFGGPGKERGQVLCPHGMIIDTRADEPLLAVADRGNNRLQYFTLDGRHHGFVTDNVRMPCHFDQRGDVLLVPDLLARVTLLDRANALIAHLGDDNDYRLRDKPRDQLIPGKFIAPHSAIFDRSGNIFVVEWVEIGRVTKLRLVG